MANSAQAKKRARQNAARYELRKSQRSALRTQIKQFLTLVSNKKTKEAAALLKLTVKRLNQLAGKKALHPGKASRLTKRLNAKLKKLATA